MANTAPANFYPPTPPKDTEEVTAWARQFTLAITAHFRRIGVFNAEGIPNEPYVTAVASAALPSARVLTGSSSVLVTDNGANSTIVLSLITSGLPYAVPAILYANTALIGSSNQVLHSNATLLYPTALKTVASSWNLGSSETSHVFGGNYYVLTPSNGAANLEIGSGFLVDGSIGVGNSIATLGVFTNIGLFSFHSLTNTAGNALQFTLTATSTGVATHAYTGAGGNLNLSAAGTYTGLVSALLGTLQLSGAGTMGTIDCIVANMLTCSIATDDINLFTSRISALATPTPIGRGFYHPGWGASATVPWSFYALADPAFFGETATIESLSGTGAHCLTLNQKNTGATEGAHLHLGDKVGNVVTPSLGDLWRFGTATKLVSSTFVLTNTGDALARTIIMQNSQGFNTLSWTPTSVGNLTMTIPPRDGELIHDGQSGAEYVQTLKFKRLLDAGVFIINDSDGTKGFRFQVADILPATGGGDGTLAGGHVVINIPNLAKTPTQFDIAVLDLDGQIFTVPNRFTVSATRGNINIIPASGDPSTTLSGDIWYDSVANKFRANENSTAIDLIGNVDETEGGTGQTTYALGDMLYASAADVLSKLAQGNTTGAIQILQQTATIPAWTTVEFEHTFILETPTSSENIGGFYTPAKVEVTEVRGVIKGAMTTVTIDIGHSTDMDETPTFDSVLTAPIAIVSKSIGTAGVLQTDGSEDIPAGEWVWMKTSADGGAGWLSVTVKMRRIF